MSTLTTKLGLKIPALSDPFLRQDYEDALTAIDRAPGIHYCTSATRPTWVAGKSDRLIFESDTRRLLYWTGSAWQVVIQPSNGWLLYTSCAATIPPSTASTRSIGSVTTSAPGTLLVTGVVQAAFYDGYVQGLSATILVDDIACSVGASTIRGNSPSGAVGGGVANVDYKQAVVFGYKTVAAGTHTIKTVISTDQGDVNVYLAHVRASVHLVNSTLDGSV